MRRCYNTNFLGGVTMNYYYNETEHSFAVTTNFKYNPVPKGFVEITKEEYERLQEELNAQKEETTTE